MDLQQLPPTYPPLINKPLNLVQSDAYKHMLEKKNSLRTQMINSYYNEESVPSEKSDFNLLIQRYSDRYKKHNKVDANKWEPNWSRLPRELKYFYEKSDSLKLKTKRKLNASRAPNLVKSKKSTKNIDLSKLDEVDDDENDENNDEEKKEKKISDSDEEENQEDLDNLEDEEDQEEENDYMDTYFDNGENYGDDDGGDGGDDDGPVY